MRAFRRSLCTIIPKQVTEPPWTLASVLQDQYDFLQLSQKSKNSRKELVKAMGVATGAKSVSVYGSTSMGIDSVYSDLDICLHSPNRTTLTKVASDIRKCTNVVSVTPIPSARFPILVVHSKDCIAADISMSSGSLPTNELKGKLIASIIEHGDWKVRALVMLIRDWARANKVNKAINSDITSFGHTLIALNYLQTVGYVPKLKVPIKYRRHIRSSRIVDKWASFARAHTPPEEGLDLAQLFEGCLKFYVDILKSDCVFRVEGDSITLKEYNESVHARSFNKAVVVVRDPIEPDENAARALRKDSLLKLHNKLAHAFTCIYENNPRGLFNRPDPDEYSSPKTKKKKAGAKKPKKKKKGKKGKRMM